MSVVKFLLNSAPALARQGISRVLPTGEERVIRGLRAYGDRFFDPANAQGLTIDPRTGKDVIPGQVVGNMMSRIPNPPNNANVVRNVDDLVNYVQSNPAVMRELQTGGYAGGWFDPAAGGLVFDPSRRYLTRGGAVRAGTVSGQKAGFDLSNFEEFPVNNQALRQAVGGAGTTIPAGREVDVARRMGIGQAAGSIVGALTGGASAAGAVTEDGNLSATDVLGVLGAGAVGALGGRSAGRSIGASAGGAGLRGVISRERLKTMRSLGVQESAEGGIGKSGMVARERARAIGVPEEKLSSINDNEEEYSAFRKAYEATLEHYGSVFGSVTGAKLKQAKADLLSKVGSVVVPTSTKLSDSIKSTFGGKVSTEDNFDNVVDNVISNPVDDIYNGMGLRNVRHVKRTSDTTPPTSQLADLANKGEVNKLSEATEDIIHNLSRFITEDDLADIARRNGVPIFYVLHNLSSRARAAMLNMPLLRLIGAQGPASARSAPVEEVILGNSALAGRQIDELVETGALVEVPPYPQWKNYIDEPLDGLKTTDAKYKAAKKKAEQNPEFIRLMKERDEAMKAGALANRGEMATRPRVSLKEIEDDLIKFMKDPLSVSQIGEKVWTYLGTTASPLQKVVSTMDSWMMRAAFGNAKVGTAKPGTSGNISLEYQIMHESLNELARRLGVPPAALQEVIWKNVRIATEKAGESFLPLEARRWMYPNLSASAKAVPEGMPSMLDIASSNEFKTANKRFVSKLIKALKEDPSISRYVRIVGDDIEFTDEFFNNLSLF